MDKHEGKNLGSATWLQFFKEAGLPTKACASYAVIFAENRISKDMLSELTVDYLRLMGVTLMGDIIAILRHCKSVHQDSLRKVVILKSKETSSKRSSSSSNSSSSSSSDGSSSSSSDDVEMIDVPKSVTRKSLANSSVRKVENVTKKRSPPLPDVKPLKSKIISKTSSSIIATDKKVAPQTKAKIVAPSQIVVQPVKRKHVEESEILPPPEPVVEMKSSSSSTGKSILKTAVLSAKKIRVIAENDMMGPKLPPPKKTVFERLGVEHELPQVSSTTEISKPEVVATKFTRTFRNISLPVSTSSVDVDDVDDDESPRPKVSSVFDRLGGLNDDVPKREPKEPALKYAGVFKSPPKKHTSNPVGRILKKVGTMRADEPEIPVKLRAARPQLSRASDRPYNVRLDDSSVKSRLKLQPRQEESSVRSRLKLQPRLNKIVPMRTKEKEPSAGIFANPYKKPSLTSRLTIKDRLGLQSRSAEKSVVTSSKRIKMNVPTAPRIRSAYMDQEDEEDGYVFSSKVELLESKKVSFGRVEKKLITPLKQMKNSRLYGDIEKTRTGVHSRLGTPNFL